MAEEWRNEEYRLSMVKKINEAIQEKGGVVQNIDPHQLENQAMARARSKEEYLNLVAKIILMVKTKGQSNPPHAGTNRQQLHSGLQQQAPMQQQQQQQGANGVMIGGAGGAGSMMPQYPVPPQQLQPQQQDQQQLLMQQQQQQQQQQQGHQQQMAMNQQHQQILRFQRMQLQQQQGQQQHVVPGQVSRPGMMQAGVNYNQMVRAPSAAPQPNQGPPPPRYHNMNQSAAIIQQRPNQQQQQQLQQPPPPVAAGGVMSPTRIPSPASMGQQHSPMSNPRSVGGFVPSPMATSIATPQHGDDQRTEDQAYFDKVKQLGKYIEPLRQMIAGIGSNEQEKQKLGKMNKLMEILTNPSKRMPMETLLKCEVVLEKMLNTAESGGGGGDVQNNNAGAQSNVVLPPVETSSSSNTSTMMNPLLDAIMKLKQAEQKNSNSGSTFHHSLNRTLGAPLEAIFGGEITVPPLPKKYRIMDLDGERTGDIPNVLQGEVARLQPHFRVALDQAAQPARFSQNLHLVCHLEDKDLPSVPPLNVTVPYGYPEHGSPVCGRDDDRDLSEYDFTPFLSKVKEALQARLSKMPRTYSLSQLLSAWEMSVRAACSVKNVQGTSRPMLLSFSR